MDVVMDRIIFITLACGHACERLSQLMVNVGGSSPLWVFAQSVLSQQQNRN